MGSKKQTLSGIKTFSTATTQMSVAQTLLNDLFQLSFEKRCFRVFILSLNCVS